MRPQPGTPPNQRRYPVAAKTLRPRAATACSPLGVLSLSQLALVGLALSVLALAGCSPKDKGSTGGLDPVVPGSIAVSVAGLPAGAPAALLLTGPGGFSRSLTSGESVSGLSPGTYTLTSADVEVDGDGWHGTPESQAILVRQGPATSSATVDYAIATGRLTATVNGVPAGGASIQVAGPNGYSRTVTGTETLKKLVPGNYAIVAPPAVADGDRYVTATPDQLAVVIVGGPGAAATFDYVLASGRLDVGISGVPAGNTPSVVVAGPHGFSDTVSAGRLFKGLEPGFYSLAASNLSSGGHLYQPTFAPGTGILVSATPVAASAGVAYALASGALTVSISGLPGGASAPVSVTGPAGYSHGFPATETVVGLTPGSYSIAAGNLTIGSALYVPSSGLQTATIAADTIPATRSIHYTVGAGNLAISVVGLPGGVAGSVDVSGPNGFSQHVTETETLSGLSPGSYTIAGAAVSSGGQMYNASPASQIKSVVIGSTATATVAYAGSLGNLTVTVNGLPGAALASVTVTGPGGFTRAVTATSTLTGLAAGTYSIAAINVSSGGQTYAPTPTAQSVAVSVGSTSSATVTYAGTLGTLAVSISGLPGGANASVAVAGPGGFNQNLTASQTLTGLTPGTYTITASNVASGPTTYAGAPLSQTASVAAGTTTSKSVAYAPTGALTVTVSGLPGGALASIAVTGPGGYSQLVTATTTLAGLGGGSYTLTSGNVASGGSTYGPTPAVQSVSVTAGSTANATVAYAVLTGVTLNLQVDGMYLTQAAAKYDGTTPVITGRDAYLRVFVKANQANTAAPAVRVRLYSGASLIQTSTVNSPAASTPTTVSEGSFTSSWNLLVPAALVQPNLRILADVDPSNLIAESDDADNNFPTSGIPAAIDVRTVPTWNVRFVPILQQVNGLQGNVTAGNMGQFLVDPLKMLPVAALNADVRVPYTTTAAALVSDNSNGAWGTILSELWALQSSDASNRYYYGVAKTSYGGGVAGIGYVGGGINVSMGWDALPSGSGIMAHEVGHNMGRQHSPCGGASSPDPGYPYAGGQIGTYGLDLSTLTVKQPTTNFDFMGYCNPDWVSDYTWSNIITYRQSNPNYAPPSLPGSTNAVAGLLVWGRVTHAGIVLEPSFRVAVPTAAPRSTGAASVEGLAADGTVLFQYPIDLVHSMTAGVQTGHEQHFATVLPLTNGDDQRLARIRLVTPSGTVERRSAQAVAAPAGVRLWQGAAARLTKPNGSQATFQWDGATYPMALIRDPATGQILSFARGGAATIWTTGTRFDITFSDGVRSVVQRLQ